MHTLTQAQRHTQTHPCTHDSKSYLSGLPWLHINVWAYFGRFFWALLSINGSQVLMHECPNINVLCIATLKCWNRTWYGRKSWINGKFWKLNQWKICISHYVLLSAESHHVWMCMHKCFRHRNIIMLEVLKPNQGWSGDGETEPIKICIGHYALLSAERSSCMNVHA